MGATKTKSVIDPYETGRESLHSLGNYVTKGAKSEAELSGKAFLQQLLGLNLESKAQPKEADHHAQKETPKSANDPVEIFNFLLHKSTSTEKPKVHAEKTAKVDRREAHINYSREIVDSGKSASKGEVREMNSNIQQIKQELAKLVASSESLKLKFADIGVDTSTPTVGKYQQNFLEWMLIVIRQARQKVEDSGAWLNAVKGKGGKKGTYDVTNGKMHQAGERTTIMNSAG
ncbi:MAG: DUF5660 family protein [Candidatus Levyibacteriota bacterium]